MFCTHCGARLEEGQAFCTACGSPVETDSQPSKAESTAVLERVEQAAPRVAQDGTGSGSSINKGVVIAVAVVAVLVAVVLVVVFLVLPAQQAAQQPAQSGQVEEIQTTQSGSSGSSTDSGVASAGSSVTALNMPYVYTTRYGEVNNNQMPNFTFRYPNGWSVGQSEITLASETVSLSKGDALIYYHNAPTETTYQVSCTAVEKVADAGFVPGWVSGTDHTGLGSFMVAKVDTERTSVEGSKMNVSFYALLPEKALSDRSVISFDGGAPCFPYTHPLSFAATIPDGGFSEDITQEIIAILASFSVESSTTSATTASDDYVLADSATHEYTAGELASYSDYQLFIARNEIYARHGRMFDSQELSTYFAGKSWYEGKYAPADFDDSLLNATEKKNALTIRQVEESRGSSYL